MPSSIFFNQQRIYRPGTYVRVVDRLSEISDTSSGNICLIGDFPIFKQHELMTFATFDALMDATRQGITYGGVDYDAIGTAAFAALAGSLGQPDSLSIINVRESAQASYTNNGLKIVSRLYGEIGLQLRCDLARNADNADLWDINIYQGDAVEPLESITEIGDEVKADIQYTPAATDYDEVWLEVSDTHLAVQARRDFTNAEIRNAGNQNADGEFVYTIDKRVEGDVTIIPSAAQINTTYPSLIIKGLTAGGSEIEEIVEINDTIDTDEANQAFVSVNEWRRIDEIRITEAATASGDFELIFYPKKTLLEDVEDLESWLNDLALRNSDFSFTAPQVFPTNGSTLDRRALTRIDEGSAIEFGTDLYRIADRAFNNSDLVTTELISNVPPTAFNRVEGSLSGSNLEAATIPNSDWQTALDLILFKNINIVVPATDEIGVHQLVDAHCDKAADRAGRERNAWLGTEADRSLNYIANAFVKDINSRNCAYVCQGIKLEKNGKEFETPWMTALCLASVQASTPVGEPMTRKILNAIRPIQTTFDPDLDANKAIRLGIVVINDSFGYVRVERSVTTYTKDPDHPVFTEVSANESINVCIRTLRATLDSFVGGKASADRASAIEGAARRHLQELRRQKVIANYRKIQVTLVGDRLNVAFDVAAIEPLNFITVTANLGQF